MNARKHRLDNSMEVPLDRWPTSGKREVLPRLRAVRPSSDAGKVAESSAVLETIVVATDFSEDAAHAVSRVGMLVDVASLSKATLLHVLQETRVASVRQAANAPVNASSRQMANAKRQLAEVADQLRQRAAFNVEGHVEAGHVVATIQCFAAAADLLVLGAQGGHPLRDLFIGSTAQRVLRNMSGPVLVVRRKAERPYRQVLVGVDFQSDPSNALNYAQALAPGAKLNLIHAYDVPFEGKMRYASVSNDVIDFYRAEAIAAASHRMSELISSRAASIAVHPLIVHGNAVPKLLEKERELGADLIVVTKRRKSLMEKFLLGSVTLQLLERSQCDVLAVQ